VTFPGPDLEISRRGTWRTRGIITLPPPRCGEELRGGKFAAVRFFEEEAGSSRFERLFECQEITDGRKGAVRRSLTKGRNREWIMSSRYSNRTLCAIISRRTALLSLSLQLHVRARDRITRPLDGIEF